MKHPKINKFSKNSMIKWIGAKNVKDIINATLIRRSKGWEDPKITIKEYTKSLRNMILKSNIEFLTEKFANLNFSDPDIDIKMLVINREIKKLRKQLT